MGRDNDNGKWSGKALASARYMTLDKGEKQEAKAKRKREFQHRRAAVTELSVQHMYRRAFSEVRLMDAARDLMPFKKGYSYHFITAGDVDMLSYLKVILNCQDIIEMVASTWSMHGEDLFQLVDWLRGGRIRRMLLCVGANFPQSYKTEWAQLCAAAEEMPALRVKVFMNHAKIFAGVGTSFPFVVETSANLNTNPRTEFGIITIDDHLRDFYASYFEAIEGFDINTPQSADDDDDE